MEPDRAVQPRAHSRADRTQTEVAAQWPAAPGRGLARPARAALLRTGRDARRRSGGRRSARSLPPLPGGGGTPRQGTHRRASAPPRLPGSGSPPGDDASLAGDRRRRSIRRRVASHRLSGVFHRREHRSRARIDLRRFNRQFGRRPRNERMRHGSARFPWPRPAGNRRAVLRRVGEWGGPATPGRSFPGGSSVSTPARRSLSIRFERSKLGVRQTATRPRKPRIRWPSWSQSPNRRPA